MLKIWITFSNKKFTTLCLKWGFILKYPKITFAVKFLWQIKDFSDVTWQLSFWLVCRMLWRWERSLKVIECGPFCNFDEKGRERLSRYGGKSWGFWFQFFHEKKNKETSFQLSFQLVACLTGFRTGMKIIKEHKHGLLRSFLSLCNNVKMYISQRLDIDFDRRKETSFLSYFLCAPIKI